VGIFEPNTSFVGDLDLYGFVLHAGRFLTDFVSSLREQTSELIGLVAMGCLFKKNGWTLACCFGYGCGGSRHQSEKSEHKNG
jgi:hypothetical protein